MNQLVEASRQLDRYGNDFAAMSEPELQNFVIVLRATLLAAHLELVKRSGSLTRADRFIRQARRLPKYRLQRKAILFEKVTYAGGTPNRPLLAAQIARMLNDADKLSEFLVRCASVATVQ